MTQRSIFGPDAKQMLVAEARNEDALQIALTTSRIVPEDSQARDLVRQLEKIPSPKKEQ